MYSMLASNFPNSHFSFCAQGLHGVDRGGATGWNIGGRQSHRGQQNRSEDEGLGIQAFTP